MLAEWGYCSLLETEHGNVMIDTGGTGHVLRHNLDFLKIDLKKVRALVLSHSHHDHISGLLDIVFSCPGIPIYAGKGIEIERRGDADASRRSGGVPVGHFPNAHLIEDYVEIVPGVYAFRVPEQNRLSQYVCCRNMWEVAPDGQIIADRFEDDVSLAVKGERAGACCLAAHMRDYRTLCREQKTCLPSNVCTWLSEAPTFVVSILKITAFGLIDWLSFLSKNGA